MRPSDIYDIHDRLQAFYFDRAVHAFGTALEADVQRARDAAKNGKSGNLAAQRVFSRWMADTEGSAQGLYRDPAIG